MSRFVSWVEDRFPLKAIISLGRDEDIVGGSSFFYTLGSATLFVFLLQVVTGVFQLFYYVPTTDHAYASLMWLRMEVPFGWLLHGFHYWGANLMVVLVGVHMLRVFAWGAYKAPRELVWLSGLTLLLLTAGIDFTGAPLPWDEAGYWVAEIAGSIASLIPFVGGFLGDVLRGGPSLGPLTLSRFFVLHVAIFPALIFALVFVHMAAFRMFGSVGPWKAEKRNVKGPFWPDQIFKDAIVSVLLLLLLVWLSAYVPPPVTGPVNPTDTAFTPEPEWNFMFLEHALRYVPAKLQSLVVVGVPGLIVLFLASLPFIDRGDERNPVKRLPYFAGIAVIVALIATLTLISQQVASKTATVHQKTASAGTRGVSVVKGEKLFHSLGCIGCHSVGGHGGTIGPSLSSIGTQRSRAWIMEQIRDPKKHFANGIMPPFAAISSDDVNQLLDYLVSLHGADPAGAPSPAASPGTAWLRELFSTGTAHAAVGAASGPKPEALEATKKLPAPKLVLGPPGRAATMIGSAGNGEPLYEKYCSPCHGADAKGGMPNPGSALGIVPALHPISAQLANTAPALFATNLDRVLENGVKSGGPIDMPAFGDTNTLSQGEIADVIAYVMSLNGADRSAIVNPGIAPRTYFAALVAATVVVGLLLAIAGLVMTRKRTA